MTARRGFTVLEVMIALVMAGILAVLAQRAFQALSDEARRIDAARADLDTTVNARRWLQAALVGVDLQAQGSDFIGSSRHMSFASWLEGADGWFEPAHVHLTGEGERLVASVLGDTLVLADSVRVVTFEYLSEPGRGGLWLTEWTSSTTPPFAIRLITLRWGGHTTKDTSLFVIGARG